MEEAFWNEAWNGCDPSTLDPEDTLRSYERRVLKRAGALDGERVLDLGCGRGRLSVLAAQLGASHVTAVDVSAAAVEATRALARHNGVSSVVEARQMDALEVTQLGQRFTLALGCYVLHHVEPFDVFAGTLYEVLRPGGRGIFYENSARNPLLMLARATVPGRMGVPKYGDDEEYPLQPREIDVLRERFESVRVTYPDFVCFRLLNIYLLDGGQRWPTAAELFDGLDALVRRRLPLLMCYSYRQIVEVRKAAKSVTLHAEWE